MLYALCLGIFALHQVLEYCGFTHPNYILQMPGTNKKKLIYVELIFITNRLGIVWDRLSIKFHNTFRNAGVGSCSFVARIGGVLSNLVGQLAETHIAIPTVMFAFSALLSAFLSLFLPETGGRKLPDTIDECKLQSSDGLFEKCCRRSKTSTKQNS